MQVRWEFKRWNGSFQPFTPKQNTKLEKAYINKEDGTEYKISEANGKVVTWKVDFKSMETTDGNNTKEIQRKPLDEGKIRIIGYHTKRTEFTESTSTNEKYTGTGVKCRLAPHPLPAMYDSPHNIYMDMHPINFPVI